MPTTYIDPPELVKPRGFAHAAVVPASSKLVFIAGQVACNAKGEMLADGDYAEQTYIALSNVMTAVRSAGATPRDIVNLTLFVVGHNDENMAAVYRGLAKASAENDLHRMAAAYIGIDKLVVPTGLIEITAVAATDA
jgi:enamine deaminase RidA (YjgF/YER057c/UK114 family)